MRANDIDDQEVTGHNGEDSIAIGKKPSTLPPDIVTTTSSTVRRVPKRTWSKLQLLLAICVTVVIIFGGSSRDVSSNLIASFFAGGGVAFSVATIWILRNRYVSYLQREVIRHVAHYIPGDLEEVTVYESYYEDPMAAANLGYYKDPQKALELNPSRPVRAVQAVKVGEQYFLPEQCRALLKARITVD